MESDVGCSLGVFSWTVIGSVDKTMECQSHNKQQPADVDEAATTALLRAFPWQSSALPF